MVHVPAVPTPPPPDLVHIVSHGPHCLDGVTSAVAVARFHAGSEVVPVFANNPEINEDAICNNLVYLHDRILGDTVGPNDAAVNASYKLFADTYAAGLQAMLDKTETNSLGSCQATKDPTTNTDLPVERQIKTDDTYVIRAWQAVVIYLLSDYKFLYE